MTLLDHKEQNYLFQGLDDGKVVMDEVLRITTQASMEWGRPVVVVDDHTLKQLEADLANARVLIDHLPQSIDVATTPTSMYYEAILDNLFTVFKCQVYNLH